MSNPIQRPIFNDGQILNAVDLGDSVDYARGQLARHERYLHSWGIAYGFELKTAPKTDASTGNSYVEVTVTAGLAIDGRGREIVLTADQLLDPSTFPTAGVYDPASKDPWYPVYVRGVLPPPVALTSLTGACAGTNLATRQTEDVQFTFKAPSPLNNSNEPYSTPAPGDPSDPSKSVQAWDILIGFVQWDGSSQFKDARTYNDAGITRRLVGVQADRVEARDGSLTLQTSNVVATKLMVVVKEKAGDIPGSMTFGGDDGNGGVTNLLQIDDKGNLSIKGTFQGGSSLPPGGVSVQSGLASDGVILPLPAGVSEDDVTGNKVVLHIQVTPVLPGLPVVTTSTPFPSPVAALPLWCSVDGDRRVNCFIRSLTYATTPSLTFVDTPGMCQYTVIAAKPALGGS